MRLQTERAPDLLNRRTSQPAGFRHASAAPVRLAARRLLQRTNDHLLNLLITDLTRGPLARLIVQPVQSLPHEPAAPLHTVVCDMRSRFANQFRVSAVLCVP